MQLLNKDFLRKALSSNKSYKNWLEPLYKWLPVYDIDTSQRMAAFLSQTAYESHDYTTLEENLNYSAERLIEVFPKHFKNQVDAELYAHKPEKIANKVYANRMGNGDEESGDGWKYRGRGIIQITGRDNYATFTEDAKANNVDVNILYDPVLVSKDKEVAVVIACWFWDMHNLNASADASDIEKITLYINGGLHALGERERLYYKLLDELD